MAVDVKGPLAGSVNMMPMIDILFQLVIFFLVAAHLQVQEGELPVVLPQASEAQPLTIKPNDFYVNIDQQGRYFVAGQMVDVEKLEQALKQAVADNPAQHSVVIRADKRGTVDSTIQVMNLCNKAHVQGYRVTTADTGE